MKLFVEEDKEKMMFNFENQGFYFKCDLYEKRLS
jgi:hypothetical protein